MKATRRRFIQTSAMVGAGVMLAGRRLIGRAVRDPIKNLRKFVDPLPLPGLQLGPGAVAGHTEQDASTTRPARRRTSTAS